MDGSFLSDEKVVAASRAFVCILRKLNAQVAECVWQPRRAGQFVYASAASAELGPIPGVDLEEGVLIVAPDAFGISGEAIAQIDRSASQSSIEAALKRALKARSTIFNNYQQHIWSGVQMGIDWQSALPVTDQQANRAKERYRGTD